MLINDELRFILTVLGQDYCIPRARLRSRVYFSSLSEREEPKVSVKDTLGMRKVGTLSGDYCIFNIIFIT
jgi:hypothetical protein